MYATNLYSQGYQIFLFYLQERTVAELVWASVTRPPTPCLDFLTHTSTRIIVIILSVKFR